MGNSFRAMNASLLNADILDRILMSLADFESLLSSILACKAIHSVYRARPASIDRAVAYNLVGPALPQAIRYLRCRKSGLWLRPNDELLGEDDFEKDPVLKLWEIQSLSALSRQTVKLEDLYSWREKDCMCRTSQLSAIESYRFRRALYRTALFLAVYGMEGYDAMNFFNNIDDDEDDDGVEEKLFQFQKMQRQFMEAFSTADLKEIDSLARFLLDIYNWSVLAQGTITGDPSYFLFTGSLPNGVLDAYEGRLVDSYDDDVPGSVYDEFILYTVSEVLENRKVPRITEEQAKVAILDEIVGTGITCKRCEIVHVPRNNLWCPTNWEYLKGVINPGEMHRTLKGNLPQSVDFVEKANFINIWRLDRYSELVGEVFEQKTDAYSGWEKEDLICIACLREFLRDHLHLWYVERRRKQGLNAHEDCWYGYDCRTQSHKLAHATRLNHFCEPTKGDAAPSSSH
ncbi:hypothetical protein F5I97DRAFT_1884339 [Phlebopus sp. FC_14]|nr:hypothetical protein F5I97DRAFT_1884339 [Phlebopus sp. FC_14]